ncbi:MAG: hypothetical protein KKG01_04930 [Candidatus Omnitrophica bacterium]|nr:hypothetical protein [Candidatus Omnitrophota bacterium]
MQNKKLLVLIVLGVAAVFSLIYGIVTPSKARRELSQGQGRAHVKGEAGVVAAEKSAPAASVAATGGPRRTSFTDWGRDPFSSGQTTSAPSTVSDMVLTGILWDDSSPLAMINDNPIAVGDKISGYTVVEIRKDRVIITNGTEDSELRLPTY